MTAQKLLILVTTFLTLACSTGSDSNKTGNPFIEGTSDSGGGSGIEGKAYEAYIVKPENLPAYKNIVAPKIKNILSLATVDADRALQLFQRWILYKTWYIAPVTLGTISKDVIGVSFSKDNTEQLAIQTKKSVWMSSARFHQMSQEDQATLIIHEMVMSLYYLKYKTWDEVSKERLLSAQPLRQEEMEYLQEMYPPTPPKPFDSNDYENIRAVTAGFLGDVKFNSVQEVDELLLAKQFDPRFTFTMGLTPGGGPTNQFRFGETTMAAKDFMTVVNSAQMLGRVPNKCRGFKFQDPFDCYFSTRLIELGKKSSTRFMQNLLQIRSSDPALTLEFAGIAHPSEYYGGGTMEFVSLKKRLSTFVLLNNPFPTLSIPGTSFYSVSAVFIEDLNQDRPQPTFLGLIAVPGVVIGRDPKNPQECTYAKPATSSVQTDTLFAYSEHLTESEKSMLRIAGLNRPTITTCVQY